MKYLEQVSPLIAHRPHPTGEAAGLQYLHSQVLASGPLHQHPKAVYMVTCEFPISAKAAPQEAGVSTGVGKLDPPGQMLTAALWEPGKAGVLLSCPCLLGW